MTVSIQDIFQMTDAELEELHCTYTGSLTYSFCRNRLCAPLLVHQRSTATTMSVRDSLILGIDFGTTYTAAAVVINGRVSFVMDGGEPMLPSVVHIPPHGDPIVGRAAVHRLIVDPSTTISSVKRLLGRKFNDKQVRSLDAGVGYRIKAGPGGSAVIHVGKDSYACEQIAGYILSRVRTLAEQRFGGTIRQAVMGVPVTATSDYIRALRRSAKLAHLEVVQVVPEPIAGALAVGLHTQPATRNLAICDFGGGTFDATLVKQEGHTFHPIATNGDPFLGGDDFDEVFAKAISSQVFRTSGYEMQKDAVRWRQLIVRCESVKRILSTQSESPLLMNDAYVSQGSRGNIELLIDRTWINPKWEPLTVRSNQVLRNLLRSASWDIHDVDDVVLIGGTSMIPLVKRSFRKVFAKDKLITNEWASLAVATGLALQAQAHKPIATGAPILV